MSIKQSIAALVILLSVSFSAFSATETIYYMVDARASCGRNNVYGLSHSELADNFAAEVSTCTHNPPVTRQRVYFQGGGRYGVEAYDADNTLRAFCNM